MTNQTTTTEHWADAVLFILKRIVINMTGVGLALGSVAALGLAIMFFGGWVAGAMEAKAAVVGAVFFMASAASAGASWWLLTKTKKGFKNGY